MKTIYKYTLELEVPVVQLRLPRDAKVVHVDVQQQHEVTFWVEFKKISADYVDRTFRIYGTGHDIPMDAEHCGTVLDSPFVWHLYETSD